MVRVPLKINKDKIKNNNNLKMHITDWSAYLRHGGDSPGGREALPVLVCWWAGRREQHPLAH